MPTFDFRAAFAAVGCELTAADQVPDEAIANAERRLECRAPAALRDFYRLAGNARRTTDHHDHFLPPREWSRDGDRLVFLAENQGVVLYAVDVASGAADPPVVMTNNREPFDWHEVCRGCSEFLRVMVHWEGAFGGAMPVTGSARVDPGIRRALASEFRFAGVVKDMWAYGRPGLAVCLVEWEDGWRVFARADGEERLRELAKLGVEIEVDARGSTGQAR